jgi:hypothetical protein
MILKITDGLKKSIGRPCYKRKVMFILNQKSKAQEMLLILVLIQIQIMSQLL